LARFFKADGLAFSVCIHTLYASDLETSLISLFLGIARDTFCLPSRCFCLWFALPCRLFCFPFFSAVYFVAMRSPAPIVFDLHLRLSFSLNENFYGSDFICGSWHSLVPNFLHILVSLHAGFRVPALWFVVFSFLKVFLGRPFCLCPWRRLENLPQFRPPPPSLEGLLCSGSLLFRIDPHVRAAFHLAVAPSWFSVHLFSLPCRAPGLMFLFFLQNLSAPLFPHHGCFPFCVPFCTPFPHSSSICSLLRDGLKFWSKRAVISFYFSPSLLR